MSVPVFEPMAEDFMELVRRAGHKPCVNPTSDGRVVVFIVTFGPDVGPTGAVVSHTHSEIVSYDQSERIMATWYRAKYPDVT